MLMGFLRRKTETRYILSIDGGGMRGIIPAVVLARLDRILREEGDERPLYSHFDLIAGTSTGALLMLALASPSGKIGLEKEKKESIPVTDEIRRGLFRRKEIITRGYLSPGADPGCFKDIYLANGPRIFPSSFSKKTMLYPIFQDKYSAAPFEELLRSMLGDLKLSQMLVPSMAVAYDAGEGSGYIMRSWESHGILAREAARASAAAPLYFSPAEIRERDTGKVHRLIDGGIIANNPALLAYSEARKLYPEAGRFVILSLSTCRHNYKAEGPMGGGITNWGGPVFKFYTQAAIEHTDIVAESIKDAEYIRIWEPVLEKRIKLDSVSEENLTALADAGERVADLADSRLRALAGRLREEATHDSVKLEGAPPYLTHDRGKADS